MSVQVPILELRNIGKSFSGISVLREINLDLLPGEVHCIVGENGAGKSTLIKIVSGAYARDAGSIKYNGQALDSLNPHWARENGINAIYQEVDLIPSLSVAENIFLGNEPLSRSNNIDWGSIYNQSDSLLKEVGANIPVREQVSKLKIAHQQMVAIAKSLSVNSNVIIFDEPTAVFTGSEIDILFDLIFRLKEKGVGILYITHQLDEIFRIGDRVTVLRDGDQIQTGLVSETDKNSLIKAMVGREIDFERRNGVPISDEVVLNVRHLTSQSGSFTDISFELKRGEIIGVAGLVGAGRTEMARTLIGATAYESGEIYFHNELTNISSPKHALDMGIGMLPENRKEEGLVTIRTVAENVGYSLVESISKFGIVPWKRVKDRINQILDRLNVKPAQPNLQVTYLSGGNQQKVVLGKWLAAQSDLLILDEPTRGVDVGAREEIYDFIQELKKDGKAILMISSDMTEILTQSDRILVMANGKIVGELRGDEANEEQVLKLALHLEEEEL